MMRKRNSFFNTLSLLLAIIAVLQFAGLYYEIWKQIEWWDTAIHFLGGLWVGGMTLWFLVQGKNSHLRVFYIACVAFGGAFIIGFGWEIYEVIVSKMLDLALPSDYVRDTLTDLGADSAGGLLAALLYLITRAEVRN